MTLVFTSSSEKVFCTSARFLPRLATLLLSPAISSILLQKTPFQTWLVKGSNYGSSEQNCRKYLALYRLSFN